MHCRHLILLLAISFASGTAAQASSRVGFRSPEQAAENERLLFRRSDDLVEIVGLSSNRARVIRSYKGVVRSGEIIQIDMTPLPCGAIHAFAGKRGLAYLTKVNFLGGYPVWRITGYLNRGQVGILRRNGLLSQRHP